MKKIIAVIGHVDHGRTCLQSAIDRVLEKERGITIVNPEEANEIKENYYFKNEALKLKCFNEPEPIQEQIFDKPKSKFHK
ncbi:hypothetical protein [Flavobacterium caseinilyticum]|uniref:Tr-type G domain-containing protein n=1 Tax=Flavobacterium caseinilyticum TaxID=2541732 RepID=A0A4V2YUC0_9FLAO|nr:hypothetical protein [Flavobacterium caseinilyticum]TDD77117.1 hypothetical protein E0F89_05830 [Flavobacterium caseinilyticum]